MGRPGKCAQVTYEFRKGSSGMSGQEPGAGGVLIRRERLVAGEQAIAEQTAEIVARDVASFTVECLDGKGKVQTEGRHGESSATHGEAAGCMDGAGQQGRGGQSNPLFRSVPCANAGGAASGRGRDRCVSPSMWEST